MKAYIFRTSDHEIDDGEIMEFESLDDCIRKLISETDQPEYVVSLFKEEYYGLKFKDSDCDWMVEIYDWYRE